MNKPRPKVKIKKENIRFFYIYKNEVQLALIAGELSRIVPVIVEGHIMQGGRILCGESREALKNRAKGDSDREVEYRIDKAPLCQKCQDGYKKTSYLWNRWVENAVNNSSA